MEQTDLDTALKEVGRIGRYQIFVYFLIGIPILLSGTYAVSYVFTAGDLNYRCRIDECDRVNNPNCKYLTDWLPNAVPYDEDDKPEQCYKYNLTNINYDGLKCVAADFNRVKIKCNNFIYEDEERTIVNDMDLHCEENKWLLALVGTIHSVGHFLNLLISGYFSDKYGRRAVLVFSAIASGTLGLARTFTEEYISFTVLEFLDALFGAGIYTAGFILAMEIVKPEHRAMSGAIIFSTTSFGKVLLGVSAMIFRDWRTFLRVNLPLSYVTLFYFWLVPESMRWLLSQRRNTDAANGLLKVVNTNKNEISNELRDLLENRPNDLVLNKDTGETIDKDKADTSQEYHFKLVFQYPKMLIRLVFCSSLWIIIVMVFYGLSLIAVSIGGNKYTDYMLVQFIEIPAALLMPYISNKFGRRKVMWISFVASGTALIVYTFVGDNYGAKLALFLLGKFSMSCAFANIYIFNSELFPTNMRHTLLGICSAFGRIGSIIAPQAPLLNFYVKNLSMYIFGGAAVIGALITLQLPETLHTKLPDTMEEALCIGKDTKGDKARPT